ncbi:MAG TPA: hypothetical protein VNS34_16675 [Rhizobiaceae bacterium]|nr:hypothetical protein [Rhizobiaceae bacterium]
MTMVLSIELDDDIAYALDQMIEEIDPGCSREIAAAAVLYDWLITSGYLPEDPNGDAPPKGDS